MKDITGQRFGRLVAVRETDMRKNGFVVWECKCDCGNTVFVKRGALTCGNTQSCGCMGRQHNAGRPEVPRRQDLTGQRFGRLVAVRETDIRKNGFIVWECKCDCGNTIYVKRGALTCGNTKSCGCLNQDQRRSNGKDLSGQRFGRLMAVRPTDMRQGGAVVWECHCDCGITTLVRSIALQSGNTKSCGCLKGENADQMHRLEFRVNEKEQMEAADKRVRKNNTSGYVGVSYNKKTEKYAVDISFQGKNNYLGTYKDINEAIDMRKKAEALILEEGKAFYARWKTLVDKDPGWAKAHPIRIRVKKDKTQGYSVYFTPELEA